ncbi:MAG: alcohol dehydrogenase catalytic domain-containing protein [Propionibacteriales bacterium]|nr:alcohol dehydrogenase catalytic domain-containing protein [Propionibacteriales bacterium]
MRALILTGVGTLEVDDIPEPPPDRRALVAVEKAGICGTDLSIRSGHIPVEYPRVLGHEVVGRVVRPGAERRFAEGARVLVDPAVSCGHCHLCMADRANLCPNGGLIGRDMDGGLAEYVAVDEKQLLPISSGVPLEDAGLLQVLGVCVRAQSLIHVFPGQVAAVIGLGVGGLLHAQLLRARGARVVGITRSESKRALAERLGATVTCAPDEAESRVQDFTDGRGADVVVESAGTVETLAKSIELVRGGGTVLQYGTIAESEGRLPFYELYYKEINLVSSRAALLRDYAASIDLVSSGDIQVAPLLSATFALDDGAAAFAAIDTRTDLIKVLLDVG